MTFDHTPPAYAAAVTRRKRPRRVIAVGIVGAVVVLGTGTAVALTRDGGNRDAVRVAESPATSTTALPTTMPETATGPAPTITTTTARTAPGPPVPLGTALDVSGPTGNPAQSAQPEDFTGVFQHWRDTCDVCDSSEVDKGITLTIQNSTDHEIDLSTTAPVRVAVICATGVTPDGRLTRPLPPHAIGDIFADSTPEEIEMQTYAAPGTTLAPGAQATDSGSTAFTFRDEPPGTATCEGAIVASSDGTWRSETLSVVARLAGFPIYTFQIVDPPTTTREETTSTTSETTTTTSTLSP